MKSIIGDRRFCGFPGLFRTVTLFRAHFCPDSPFSKQVGNFCFENNRSRITMNLYQNWSLRIFQTASKVLVLKMRCSMSDKRGANYIFLDHFEYVWQFRNFLVLQSPTSCHFHGTLPSLPPGRSHTTQITISPAGMAPKVESRGGNDAKA